MTRVSFIGAGNVAWNIAHAFDLSGLKIHEVYASSLESAKQLASKFGAFYSNDVTRLDTSVDVVVIAVNDQSIIQVLDSVKDYSTTFVHTSGAVPIESLTERHMNGGVLYPFQSLSKDSIQSMEHVPFLIEGTDDTSAHFIQKLADQISSDVHFMDSNKRMRVHIAGVLANNFGNHLYTLARDFLKQNDLPAHLVTPLMTGMLKKYETHPPEELQTGPAVRFDESTIASHEAVIEDQEILDIYRLLTESIQKRHPQ
jgi:predicted short-subunit dehydrogenase-like oxidoreductase (DUF2520 family)